MNIDTIASAASISVAAGLLISVSLPAVAEETDNRWAASMGSASFNVGAMRDVVENAVASPVVARISDAPISIDDCSVFLAYGSHDDPTIVDCVGVEIRSADFEMPPPPYFLMNATGDVIDRADVPVVVTLAEFRSLPIDGGVLEMQPAAAQVLVNIETIAWSTARTHVLGTTILGTPVAVRATPIAWSWDFGAGTPPFTTTTPGGPYPDLAVSRTYARTAASQTIGLTVTWSGEYRVNGAGPWLPIAGTTTTSSTSAPFDVVEAPARLVAQPEG